MLSAQEHFLKATASFATLTEQQLDLLWQKTEILEIKKNDFLLREGQVCSAIWFVSKGAVRTFQINDEGTEEIRNLYTEGDWVMDYESFTGRKPARGFIQAYEACEVVQLSVHSLHALIQLSPAFFMLGRVLEKGVQPFSPHSSPEQKYRDLLSQRPQLFQTFPLHLIASYLAIAPETLSRIRKKLRLRAQ